MFSSIIWATFSSISCQNIYSFLTILLSTVLILIILAPKDNALLIKMTTASLQQHKYRPKSYLQNWHLAIMSQTYSSSIKTEPYERSNEFTSNSDHLPQIKYKIPTSMQTFSHPATTKETPTQNRLMSSFRRCHCVRCFRRFKGRYSLRVPGFTSAWTLQYGSCTF